MNTIENPMPTTNPPGHRSRRREGAEFTGFPAPPISHRRLYRSRHGLIFGVCKGLAEFGQLPVFWIRVILIGVTLLTWILPLVILYTVAAFLIRPETQLQPEAEEDWRDYCQHASSQSIALTQLKRDLDEVEYRILRMERDASLRQYDWDRRFREGK